MRFYGNVKGFTYRNTQPLAHDTLRRMKYKCPKCGRYFTKEFFMRGKIEYGQCKFCREQYALYTRKYLHKLREQAPQGYGLCSQCHKFKPLDNFTRKGREWKTCNECSEKRRPND